MIIIDRFEGNWAVCEIGGEMVNIPKTCIPKGAEEGTALNLVIADNSADRERVAKKQNSLFK